MQAGRPEALSHKGGWRAWQSGPAVRLAQGAQQGHRLCGLVRGGAAASGSEGVGDGHTVF